MTTAKEALNKINTYLEDLTYSRKPESLYEPIRYVLSIGGKRIRPVLMLLTYGLYRDDDENILPTACAIETYHNYTLLHDDLMDNADLRRGQQTVHRKWDANKAILSGDSMLVLAFQQIINNGGARCMPVLKLFAETALQVGEGQEYDMSYENRSDVTESEYIEMIRLKTSVLIACAIKIGAILAGASDEDAESLYKFGEQVGLAFQLQDDFLDVYGDTKVFGKAIGGDIVSNKKTYMLINAQNRANNEQRKELEMWINKSEFDAQDKINAVTKLYNEIGIDHLAQDKIVYYFEQSRKYIDAVDVPLERKKALMDYVSDMMARKF